MLLFPFSKSQPDGVLIAISIENDLINIRYGYLLEERPISFNVIIFIIEKGQRFYALFISTAWIGPPVAFISLPPTHPFSYIAVSFSLLLDKQHSTFGSFAFSIQPSQKHTHRKRIKFFKFHSYASSFFLFKLKMFKLCCCSEQTKSKVFR